MIPIIYAIKALVPNPICKISGDSYDGIKWADSRPLPSASEIQEKRQELQADYDSKQYQRDRAAAYPSWEDQLDNIFHNGIDAWKADIQAIKDQYPKP
jgi:hypothetical protein